MDYLILISINSFQKVVSTPMPPFPSRENGKIGGWFVKYSIKKYFRLPRALEKYRKLYISPLEIPISQNLLFCEPRGDYKLVAIRHFVNAMFYQFFGKGFFAQRTNIDVAAPVVVIALNFGQPAPFRSPPLQTLTRSCRPPTAAREESRKSFSHYLSPFLRKLRLLYHRYAHFTT